MATHALAGSSVPARDFPASPRAGTTLAPRHRPGPAPLPAGRFLPVVAGLAGLFPGGGLPRGGTVLLGAPPASDRFVVPGAPGPASASPGRVPGLTSLLLLLLAGASSGGDWCAVVGMPELGLAAACELGADLSRLVLIPYPGSQGRWQSVVSTLLETVDLVCFAPDCPVRPTEARRLSARARERGSTLVVLDSTAVARGILCGDKVRPRRAAARWPGPCDLRCAVRESSWSGLGLGHGRLGSLQIEAEVGGRGAASLPRRSGLRLPV